MKLPRTIFRTKNYITKIYLSQYSSGTFKLGITTLPTPHRFTIEPATPRKQERTASGKLAFDSRTIKKRFTLWYRQLLIEEATILQNITQNEPLSFEYPGGTSIVIVQKLYHKISPSSGQWQDITLILEEE